jgi:hypothetical protein
MLNFDNFEFLYEPFAFGHKKGILAPDVYKEMIENFPPIDLYNRKVDKRGTLKFYLDNVKTVERYQKFLSGKPVWRELDRYIRSRQFLDDTFKLLMQHKIDVGYFAEKPSPYRRIRTAVGDVLKRGRLPEFPKAYYGRFQFSILPASGGMLLPHTDQQQKIVTLVIYLPKEGEWDPAWGGGLELCRPKDVTDNFNWMNRKLHFDATQEIVTFPYEPNSCTLFIKAFNSLHCVRPMTAKNSDAMRKTLTINIETN